MAKENSSGGIMQTHKNENIILSHKGLKFVDFSKKEAAKSSDIIQNYFNNLTNFVNNYLMHIEEKEKTNDLIWF